MNQSVGETNTGPFLVRISCQSIEGARVFVTDVAIKCDMIYPRDDKDDKLIYSC